MNETLRGGIVGAMIVVIAIAIGMQWRDAPADAEREPALPDPAETTLPRLPPPAAPIVADGARRERLRAPVVDAPVAVIVTESRRENDPRGTGVRRRIARSNEAVAVTTMRARDDEWWFGRNPIDPGHFEAVQVDRKARVLRLHGCSDLIERGIAGSFAELAQLGVAAGELASLHADGRFEEAFGLRFERRVASDEAVGAIRELWWNDAWKLPLRVVRSVARRGGVQRELQEIVELHPGVPGVDLAELVDPRSRLPDFATWENVDWLEKLEDQGEHGHAGAGGAAGPAASAPPHATRIELETGTLASPEAADEPAVELSATPDEERLIETALPELPPAGRVFGSSEERERARRDAESAGSPFPPRARSDPDD